MVGLGVLDKVLAVLEDAELLCVEVASHLAERCALLQPGAILCLYKFLQSSILLFIVALLPAVGEPRYQISLPPAYRRPAGCFSSWQ